MAIRCITLLMKLWTFASCNSRYGCWEELSEEVSNRKLQVFNLEESSKYLMTALIFTEEFARQMDELQCKFVAFDVDTEHLIKKALTLCDWECHVICVGDATIENALDFSQLKEDDGSGIKSN
jgi:hypothetical protein